MCLLLGLGAQVGQGERPGCLELKGRNQGTQNKACSHGPGLHLRLLLQALLTLRSVGCLWLPPHLPTVLSLTLPWPFPVTRYQLRCHLPVSLHCTSLFTLQPEASCLPALRTRALRAAPFHLAHFPGASTGSGPAFGVLPGEVVVTSAFPPRVQQLLILFMASEDDDQFLPGLVLYHPHHALQTGAAREAPLLGERLGVGWWVGAASDLEPHTRCSLFRMFCSRGQDLLLVRT